MPDITLIVAHDSAKLGLLNKQIHIASILLLVKCRSTVLPDNCVLVVS